MKNRTKKELLKEIRLHKRELRGLEVELWDVKKRNEILRAGNNYLSRKVTILKRTIDNFEINLTSKDRTQIYLALYDKFGVKLTDSQYAIEYIKKLIAEKGVFKV